MRYFWKPKDKKCLTPRSLSPSTAQVFYARLWSHFRLFVFSACYKQLKVSHLKHPYLIFFPGMLVPAASCAGVLLEASGLDLRGTKVSGNREIAIWLNSDTAKHERRLLSFSFLAYPIFQPSAFHSLFWSHYLSYGSYILGETQNRGGNEQKVQLPLKVFF